MSYAKEREACIAQLTAEGWPLRSIRTVLARANTAQRLAVAMCNGDYPADNGERRTVACPKCESHWAPASMRRNLCPDCRNDEALTKAVPPGWKAITTGDPRGYVARVARIGTDFHGSTDRGIIYIPAREY